MGTWVEGVAYVAVVSGRSPGTGRLDARLAVYLYSAVFIAEAMQGTYRD
jgi:hypothetical protein